MSAPFDTTERERQPAHTDPAEALDGQPVWVVRAPPRRDNIVSEDKSAGREGNRWARSMWWWRLPRDGVVSGPLQTQRPTRGEQPKGATFLLRSPTDKQPSWYAPPAV